MKIAEKLGKFSGAIVVLSLAASLSAAILALGIKLVLWLL